jgi:cation diffusion facilitator family transporter
MTPQRRTALVSVAAAVALVTLKLATGLASGSLGLVAEALHSGTDLIAALLTFFAIGVAERPADASHPWGHGKVEHLSALAEASVLALVSVGVAGLAVAQLAGLIDHDVKTAWWAFAVIGVVLALDVSRTLASWRAGREYGSPALLANALHFASDLVGTLAVLAGLVLAAAGYAWGDAVAALFVAVLVLGAAFRLMRRNVDVLMDRSPADAELAARRAIGELSPGVELRRLRLRQAAGKHFVDVVIGVPATEAVGGGHAIAHRVEDALERVLPESDVVVHVEPGEPSAELRERAHAAALGVPRVREIHNLSVVNHDGGSDLSLHLKLPGDVPLEEAHAVAEEVERAIKEAVPEIETVQTHLEPLAETAVAHAVTKDAPEVIRIVTEETGEPPRELRFLHTDEGLVAFLTLGLDPRSALSDAHARASEIEERIRRALPDVADVIVHTEP